jgi:hypothetical protein
MQSYPIICEAVQEGIGIPPDAAFLKEVLSALILLAAASGTVVFLLL